MMDAREMLLTLIKKPYSRCPHVLVPLNGRCFVHALETIEVGSFETWYYYDAPSTLDDPSIDFARPEGPIRVQASIARDLEIFWGINVSEMLFPELLYLPAGTSVDVYKRLSKLCKHYRWLSTPPSEYVTGIKNILVGLDWVYAPLHIPGECYDSATFYCLFLSNNPQTVELVELAMLDLGVRTFKLVRNSKEWPIPDEAEIQARHLD